MSNNPKARITELDFDEVKANLLEMYANQDHWKGYDFEGAGLNFIADQLAYALHYASFYGNMTAAEAYLDSAVLRASIVSRAKELGYFPRSVTAARVELDVELRADENESLPSSVVIEKGTEFVSVGGDSGGQSFTCVETRSSTSQDGDVHLFESIDVRQGRYKSIDFIVDETDPNQRFVLPHSGIDADLLEVYVQEGTDDTETERYALATTIIGLTGDSRVYFIEETSDGRNRVLFGDGILGKALPHSKIVRCVYFETEGPRGNSVLDFDLSTRSTNRIDPAFLTGTVEVVANGPSHGGSVAEDKESIKFNAPKRYSSRNRAVTDTDWAVVIRQNFSDVKSVKVWGGEEENSPFGHYGRVYVAINPSDGAVLTRKRKDEILTQLRRDHRILGINPVIVDRSIVWIVPDVEITLSRKRKPSVDVLKEARKAVRTYSTESLERFDSGFEHSKVTGLVDEVDPAVSNTVLRVSLEGRLPVEIGETIPYEFSFGNPIEPGTLTSTPFTWDGRRVVARDRNGEIYLVRANETGGETVKARAGTVDYDTGRVTLTQLRITRADHRTHDLRLRVNPSVVNLGAGRNRILKIDPAATDIRSVSLSDKNEASR